jgi:predicted O-methyltransferase YrrM
MNDENLAAIPEVVGRLQAESRALGFAMACEPKAGSLLRTLAASKPGGSLLELGTGTGAGAAWLLAGMADDARLVSIDNDPRVAEVARRHLSGDPRATFLVEDAAGWMDAQPPAGFDLVFADAWVGKYSHLDAALRLLKPGGFYVVDDMLPQANWPEGHAPNVERLVVELEGRADLILTRLGWSSGLVVACVRR